MMFSSIVPWISGYIDFRKAIYLEKNNAVQYITPMLQSLLQVVLAGGFGVSKHLLYRVFGAQPGHKTLLFYMFIMDLFHMFFCENLCVAKEV